MAGYRDLKVWQLAMDLAEQLYQLCAKFPKHEVYGLTSQLQRAAVAATSRRNRKNAKRLTKIGHPHLKTYVLRLPTYD